MVDRLQVTGKCLGNREGKLRRKKLFNVDLITPFLSGKQAGAVAGAGIELEKLEGGREGEVKKKTINLVYTILSC